MKVYRQEKWKLGWFVGDFEETAYKTNQFEVCYKVHPKGEIWEKHYHPKATEINYLIRGQMTVLGETIYPGDVFVINPGEIADPQFQENCELIVIKTPSLPNDKCVIV